MSRAAMDWPAELSHWRGRFAELRIEDRAGEDPVAPPKVVMLHRIAYSEDRESLLFYMNEQQFLSVPVREAGGVMLHGKVFESTDADAQLVYKITLI
ncbi:MAG TPA: hypothetical protein VMS09_06525 [Paenibacillus sp.]|uniref:hypothetical protein n=1 Tax=Paenibacillus sp. TaxID=58172 RepID=UPI0028D1130D|nr:hypothetical protein [Paenibacillus sp.]HUC91675.1 hypothetical protein [Paenibacillus sp.]